MPVWGARNQLQKSELLPPGLQLPALTLGQDAASLGLRAERGASPSGILAWAKKQCEPDLLRTSVGGMASHPRRALRCYSL